MFRVVCSTLVLSVFFSIMNAHAVDRYRVNVKANHNRYTNTSTYDIDVSRTGLRRIQFPEPDGSALRNVPTMGETIMQLYREQPYANRANAQAKRAQAETNLLNAQAELVRFQLQEAKKRSRQRQQVISPTYDMRKLFLIACNNDVEVANWAYTFFDGDIRAYAKVIAANMQLKTRTLTQIRKSFMTRLGCSSSDAGLASFKIGVYHHDKDMSLGWAVMTCLIDDCGLSVNDAVIAMTRLSE